MKPKQADCMTKKPRTGNINRRQITGKPMIAAATSPTAVGRFMQQKSWTIVQKARHTSATFYMSGSIRL